MPRNLRPFPRLLIGAPQGRSGKTTVALGLCAALRARGLAVQPYKKGPDYIDPSWLGEAAGRPCRSLDPFFYDQPEALLAAFVGSARGADLSLIEGNHGLFDSYDEAGLGSSASIARTLRAPILLVVDAARATRSVAAIVHGCQSFEADTPIAGVILNNVARARHETRARLAVEHHCGVPVLGALPRDELLRIPDRHLGLIPRLEGAGLLPVIEACRQAAEQHLDLDRILEISRSASALAVPSDLQRLPRGEAGSPRIGIVRDRAFTFYYPENLEALESLGAQLVFIDALSDSSLPDLDALYIGGGFPEMFMDELDANASLRHAIRKAVQDGLPVYAECGGMIYLSQRVTWGEKSAEMVGALPCEFEMTGRPQGHGYVNAAVDAPNPFFDVGVTLRGHEFHHCRLVSRPASPPLATALGIVRGDGLGSGRDGIVVHNVLASFTHLHVAGAPGWAAGLVRRARERRESVRHEVLAHG